MKTNYETQFPIDLVEPILNDEICKNFNKKMIKKIS